MHLTLNLSGQTWDVEIPDDQLRDIYEPLLDRLIEQAGEVETPRYVVFVAAPPGSGKTTLTVLLQTLAADREDAPPVQALPMDGFHLPNSILDTTTTKRDGEEVRLRRIKGAPETYDLPGLTTKLRALWAGESLAWPAYDRARHDPVPEAIEVIRGGIVLVEGNYLLLDEPGWRDLRRYAHFSLFIHTDEAMVEEATVARHVKGGRSAAEARLHYRFSDLRNRRRILAHQLAADLTLDADADRRLSLRQR